MISGYVAMVFSSALGAAPTQQLLSADLYVHNERLVGVNWKNDQCYLVGQELTGVHGEPERVGVVGWGDMEHLQGIGYGRNAVLELSTGGAYRASVEVPFYQVRDFGFAKGGVEIDGVVAAWNHVVRYCSMLGRSAELYRSFGQYRRRSRQVLVQLVLQEIFVKRACNSGGKDLFRDARVCAKRGRCASFASRIATGEYCPVVLE